MTSKAVARLLKKGALAAIVLIVVALFLTSRFRSTVQSSQESTTGTQPVFPETDTPASLASDTATDRTAVVPEESAVVKPETKVQRRSGTLAVMIQLDGQVVSEGKVNLQGRGLGKGLTALVDKSSGRATFSDVPLGTCTVTVTDIPNAWVIKRSVSKNPQTRGLPQVGIHEGLNEAVIELERGAFISGTVWDRNHKPVNEALVRFSVMDSLGRYLFAEEVPIVDGRFLGTFHVGTLTAQVMRDTSRVPLADHPLRDQTPPPIQALAVAANASYELVFQFGSGSEHVDGQIVDENMAPFEGLSVQLSRLETVSSPRQESEQPLVLRQGLKHATTAPDGKFSFGDLEPGMYQIVVEPEGYNPTAPPGKSVLGQRPESVRFELRKGEVSTPLSLKLRRAHPIPVQGLVTTHTWQMPKMARLILEKGDNGRSQDSISEVAIQPGGQFSFYIDSSETHVLLAFSRGSEETHYPLDVDVNRKDPYWVSLP